MPDWLAILKAYVDTLETIVGAEGGLALADKLTVARASLLDQITALRMAELDPANLPADIDLIKGYTDTLEAAIGAIEGATTLHNKLTAARAGYLDNINQAGLLQVTAARATLLDQITALRMAELDPANLPADVDLIKGYTDTLEAAIGAIEGATTLHNKLTAARALLLDRLALLAAGGAGELTAARTTNLDELGAANIPLDIDGLKTSRDRQLFSMDFWSNSQEEVSVPAVAATLALPSVTVADLPAGATIVRAIVMFKTRMIENINAAANKLDGATVAGTSQVIQIQDSAASGWNDAINFVDDQFGIAAGPLREGGDVLFGSIDVSGAGKVDANDTYSIRWLLAKADLASLNFNDCACGIRIWYSV